jgi:hypothetical protein
MAQSIEEKFMKQTAAALSHMGFNAAVFTTKMRYEPEYVQARWLNLIESQKECWQIEKDGGLYDATPAWIIHRGLR